MKIADSKDKQLWLSTGPVEVRGSYIMSSKASLFVEGLSFESSKIKVVGRKLSGNGKFSIVVKSAEGSILFKKDLSFTKKTWSEYSVEFSSSVKNGTVEILRANDSFGRVEIARVIVNDSKAVELPAKNEQKDKSMVFDDYLKLLESTASKRKVAVIIPYSIYGGAEVYLKNIFENTKDFFSVDFLYMHKNDLEFKLSNKSVNHKLIKNSNRLSVTLKNNNYDCIVFYNSISIYNALLKLKKGGSINSSLIEVYHSDFQWPDALSRVRERRYVRKIIRISDSLANDIEGVSAEDKITVKVGIDTDKFVKNKNKNMRAKLKIPSKKFVFGTVARLSPEKDIHYLLSLAKHVSDANFVIIGSGPQAGKLRLFAKENKIDNVFFLGKKDDIQDYLNIFDGFLLTSKIEGTPISIIEAMSCGIPVFSTDVGEIRSNFGHLKDVRFLTRTLKEDASILINASREPKHSQELRDYILANHDKNNTSREFFANLLSTRWNFEKKDENSMLLVGDYL